MSVSISLDDAAAARAWFAEAVEPLADSFEPQDVERYVSLFAEVLEAVEPSYSARALIERYRRIRHPRAFTRPEPENVCVLSRVTLGADVAITSVLLEAAKRRFPKSRIWFVGPRKAYELFIQDRRIQHLSAPYNRTGSIRERVSLSQSIAVPPDSIVIDPDSRLTQLGLVPICPERNYYFLESRAWNAGGSLSQLAAIWAAETFGVTGTPYIAVPPAPPGDLAVSLGTGENPAKRIPDPFERVLMERLAATGRTILVDKGAGGEESERVERAAAGLPNVHLFEGAFARFAAHIAASKTYIGYDSAAQHVAAACGIPLITIFAGYPNPRFFERWRPTGPGPLTVLDAKTQDAAAILDRIGALVSWR